MTHLKIFILGFVVGVVAVFVSTLGLVLRLVEILQPILVPARFLFMPFTEFLANMPGAINILLLSVVNGLLWGVVFLGFSKLLKK